MEGHEEGVKALAYSPLGQEIISGDGKGFNH